MGVRTGAERLICPDARVQAPILPTVTFPFSPGCLGPFLFRVLYSYNVKLWEFFP